MRSNSLAIGRIRAGTVAFTLVELLVVIAIIAVLASLLLPALTAAKSRAKQAACSSNMRQLGLAILMYADDFRGLTPLTTHGSNDGLVSWIHTLQPYLGSGEDVRLCPSDARANERRTNNGTSYVLNEFLAVPLLDPFGRELDRRYRLDTLDRPVETPVLFEIADSSGINEFADHTHSRGWVLGWEHVIADIQPDRHRTGSPRSDRTRGSANYLFADGHVEGWKAQKLKGEIEDGVNIADPNIARRMGTRP